MRSNIFFREKLRCSTALAAALVISAVVPAFAQEGNTEIVLEGITIYGAKDANTLKDTSSSVGVVTEQAIRDNMLRTFRDAFRRLANVMDADWNDAGFLIRGVNSEGFVPGGAPLASVYIDGVQQTVYGARRGARGLWDVEQVEVYRGPQSTLSGRAALAGAIYIKTKDPTFERSAEMSGTIGNNDLWNTAFMVNMPVVQDQLAVRFAGEFERFDSDLNYENYAGFDRYDDLTTAEYYNLRGKVLWTPAEMPGTRALFSYSFAHDRPTIDDIAGPGLGFDFDERRGDFNDPVFMEVRSSDVHNVGLEVTHEISDALRFTSLTGYTHTFLDRPSVNEGTAGEINVLAGDRTDVLGTQEFRLNYEVDRLSWIAGIYGSYEEVDSAYDRTSFSSRNDISRSSVETANAAVFGEVTYEFVPTWKATLGGRVDYTSVDQTEFFSRQQPLGGATRVITDYASSTDDVNFVPKIGISKDFGENQTAGFVFSQGFRTGGGGFDRSAGVTYTYEPEWASNYELFYKGSLLDDRLTLNANVFYTDFSNQQVEMRTDPLDTLSNRIVNAASAHSYGFEFEPSFAFTEQFTAFASVGYVYSRFDEFDDANLGDLSGLPFPEAPEWSVGIGGTYNFLNGIYVGADAKYTSSYLARFGTPPQDEIDSRVILNVQTGYRTESWELNAFAENLLDEEYFVYNDNDIAATLGKRRTFGVNVKARF
ncbi:MAG: TonB-dependent receptor [Rhizobiaceae bacterium]|jgi:outer membrane receptor protein involved in Fe transport